MAPADIDDDDEDVPGEKRFKGTRTRDLDFLAKNGRRNGVVETKSGLQYKVNHSGDESNPKPGPSTPCKIHYRGMLTDGTEFDSSYKRGEPSVFRPNQVVSGWCEAMQMMREGDRWEVILPSHLAYGERGAGPIPSGAVLIFEMEMIEVGVKEQPEGGGSSNMVFIGVLIALGLALMAYQHFSRPAGPPRGPLMSLEQASNALNPRVFFDMEIGGEAAGRLEFELFARVVPRTAENFRSLCTGEKGVGQSGKNLHYKGSKLHRIIPGFMAQGGDITKGDGRGGESIYGRQFADEWDRGVVHHTEPYLLSMANRGRDTQSSQFFITVAKTSWLDGKHVVFGRLVGGEKVLKAIEAVGSSGGTPSQKVVIADSGQLSGGPIELDLGLGEEDL